MRLDFSKLTQNSPKTVGTLGTLGTTNTGAGLRRPHHENVTGDTGDKIIESRVFVPNVPTAKNHWGQRKAAPVAVSPMSPMSPAKNGTSHSSRESEDLIREFMEVDGMTLEQAEAMAAISIRPRPITEWLANIRELERLIGVYCLAARINPESAKRIREASKRQSLASIPDCLAWFRHQCEALERQKQG